MTREGSPARRRDDVCARDTRRLDAGPFELDDDETDRARSSGVRVSLIGASFGELNIEDDGKGLPVLVVERA